MRTESKSPLPKEILLACRRLRRDATDAEQILWRFLRDRRFGDVKFRRQYPVGRFITDFYCHKYKLVIELDGGGHTEPEQARYDKQRTEALESEGIRVLRFWNNDVLFETKTVLEIIWNFINEVPHPGSMNPHPNPLPKGEGDKCVALSQWERD